MHEAGDPLTWLVYLLSLPLGAVAGIAAALRLNKQDPRPPLRAGIFAATFVIVGVAVNHAFWYVIVI